MRGDVWQLEPSLGCVADLQARHLLHKMLQREPRERIDSHSISKDCEALEHTARVPGGLLQRGTATGNRWVVSQSTFTLSSLTLFSDTFQRTHPHPLDQYCVLLCGGL